MILGAHTSTSGGVDNAIAEAAELGISAVQIFAKNQRQWKAKPLDEEVVERWHAARKEHGVRHAVSHSSYLINLCADEEANLGKSLDSLTDELERAELLGLTDVVVHPGSHKKQGEEWGIKRIAASLDELHKRLPGIDARISLEVTAGQGTNLGYRFEQIAGMIELTAEPERLSVTYDSCHGHAAGYDLTSDEAYERTWASFDELIGLKKLALFHLNDTKHELGSKRDRHDKIGDGKLGLEPFRRLLNDTRFAEIPAFLETPEDDERGGYATDLKTLRKLLA